MSKQPYIPFYVGDYIKDTRILPLAVRGAWVDLILFMWEAPVRGEITGTLDDFARMMSCEKQEANFALILLREKCIADVTFLENSMIKIVSRKMKKKEQISKTRRKAGKKGGLTTKTRQNFAQAKRQAKSEQNTEYEYEYNNGINLNKKESEILVEYDQWTKDIVSGNDHFFEQMFVSESIPPGPNIQYWVLDHRDLLNRYPKMRPPNQNAFRKSCIKHIRENFKKPINGTASKKQQQNNATDEYLKKHYSEKFGSK